MKTDRMPRHVRTLDSMRSVSALIVLASHLVQIFWLPVTGLHSPLHVASNLFSETAVIVFFLLSGYLITMSIWRNIGRTGHFAAGDYVVSRLVRIYPPLLSAITVTIGVFYIIGLAGLPGVATPLRQASDLYAVREFLTFDPHEVFSALQMRGGLLDLNGPLWSLYIEVALYAAAGALALGWKGPKPYWRLIGCVLFAAFCAFILHRDYTLYAAWWLMGSAFFLCQISPRRNLVLGLAVAVLSTTILRFTTTGLITEMARLCVTLPLAFLMFLVWRWESRPLEKIASFSYTLYLIHFPVLILCYSIFLSLQASPSLGLRGAATALATMAALAAAWGLGQHVENTALFRKLVLSPFQRVSRKAS